MSLAARLAGTAVFVWLGMVAVLGSAWAFELAGYAPCALCLEQRNPYYIAIAVLGIGLLVHAIGVRGPVLKGTLTVVVLSMVATALIGGYHAGVEWGWFEAPATCGAGLSGEAGDAGSLLDSLAASMPPKCDEAAGRFLGLSFAGWNVIAASALALIALRGALAARS